MKDIKNLVSPNNLNRAMEQGSPQSQPPSLQQKQAITEQTIVFVNRVMKTILANSPAWSISLKGTGSIDDYRQQLVKAFLENNITQMMQVELGLKRIRKEPTNFLPSVGQFINWCSPTTEAIGCPDVDEAYREACYYKYSKKTLSHPCIAYALNKITMFELANKSEAKTKPRFEKLYIKAVGLFYYGDPLQEYVDLYTRHKNDNLAQLADLRSDAEYQKRNMAAGKSHIAIMKEQLKKGRSK